MKIIDVNSPIKSGIEIETILELLPIDAGGATFGIAVFGSGLRHPPEGLASHLQHEISYIVEGRMELHTEQGTKTLEPGQVIWLEPEELHATTAITDSKVFYVLYG